MEKKLEEPKFEPPEEDKPEPETAEPEPDKPAHDKPAGLELPLGEAVRIAVQYNQQVLIDRLGVDIADALAELPKAEFDEYFATIATLGQQRQANAYALATKDIQKKYGNAASTMMGAEAEFLEFLAPGGEVSQSESFNLTLSLSQKFITGTSYTLAAGSIRRETESTMEPYNPGYYPYASITLTQPLLKGFGIEYNRTGIELAKYGKQIAAKQYLWTLLNTVADTEKAYWGLILARETLEVQNRSLKRAKELLRQTRERVRVGEAAKLDELQPEATVADIEAKITGIREQIKTARDALILVMRPSVKNIDWDLEIIPATEPRDNASLENLGQCLEQAFINRPDLAMARLNLQSKKLDENKMRKERLPQLDLSGTMQWNGVDSNFGNARDRLGTGRFYDWEVSLNFILPVRLRAERAAYRRSRLETNKAQHEMTSLEHLVLFEVRSSHRGVKTALEEIRARRKAVKAATDALKAEQLRRDEGLSTNFEVLAAQEFLALAELGLIQAKIQLQITFSDLNRALGTSLKIYGIDDAISASGKK
ncbi:MAG: TolC family protein [Planctomycetota bacterium]